MQVIRQGTGLTTPNRSNAPGKALNEDIETSKGRKSLAGGNSMSRGKIHEESSVGPSENRSKSRFKKKKKEFVSEFRETLSRGFTIREMKPQSTFKGAKMLEKQVFEEESVAS